MIDAISSLVFGRISRKEVYACDLLAAFGEDFKNYSH
jgi:hypothetical protein